MNRKPVHVYNTASTMIDICSLDPKARTVLFCGAGERSRGLEVLDI